MSQARARAMLRRAALDDYNEQMDAWEDLQDDNRKAMTWASVGRLLGKYGAPMLLGLGGPLTIGAAAIAAGAGSFIGSEIGEAAGGGVKGKDSLATTGLRSDVRRRLSSAADEMYGGFQEKQYLDAGTDMLSAYLAAGGQANASKWENGLAGELSGEAYNGMDTKELLQNIFSRPKAPSYEDIDTINQGNWRV